MSDLQAEEYKNFEEIKKISDSWRYKAMESNTIGSCT